MGALRRLLLGHAGRGHLGRGMEPRPRVLGPGREQRVGVRRPHRVLPRVEVRDVLVVGVEPVERVADVVGRVHEVLGVSHLGRLVEALEAHGRVELVHVGRAEVRVDDRLALDAAAGDHDPVRGPLGLEGHVAGGRRVAQVGLPGLVAGQGLHLNALPVQQVVVGAHRHRAAARVAQRRRERVDDVLARGRGRPRVVLAVPELHVQVRPRERRAPGVDSRAVDVLLHQDLRAEVAHLRAHHGERMAAGAVGAADQERVGHAAAEGQERLTQVRGSSGRPRLGSRRGRPGLAGWDRSRRHHGWRTGPSRDPGAPSSSAPPCWAWAASGTGTTCRARWSAPPDRTGRRS